MSFCHCIAPRALACRCWKRWLTAYRLSQQAGPETWSSWTVEQPPGALSIDPGPRRSRGLWQQYLGRPDLDAAALALRDLASDAGAYDRLAAAAHRCVSTTSPRFPFPLPEDAAHELLEVSA